MKKIRKLICLLLTVLLTINLALPVGAEEAVGPTITNLTDSNPVPVINQLSSNFLPSGYNKFAVRLIGTNFSDDASVTNIYLYDSNNNIISSGKSIKNIFQHGTTDKGLDADIYINSSYNNNYGLKNGESYSLVVEINGIKSQQYQVEASNVPMINMPMSWNITPHATKYYVEFKGYNLQGLDGNVTNAKLIDYKTGTPVVIAETNNAQIIEDYIDNEHLKVYFESVDLSNMSLDEVAMFEMVATIPCSYVTGDIGIRLSDASYVTSYGYSNRSTEYYYNAYGFNLTGSYTLTFTNTSDSSKTYSVPLEMLTEDHVYYKANVSIPKDMDLPSGTYDVVMKDEAGNEMRSRTDTLTFGEFGIQVIKPSILPANHFEKIYIELQCFGIGTDGSLTEIRLFDPDNPTQNIIGQVMSKKITRPTSDSVNVFHSIELISGYNNNNGLINGKTYHGEIYYNGVLFDTFSMVAEDNPLVRNMYPSYVAEGIPGMSVAIRGWNLDKVNLSTTKAELLLKQADDSFIKIGEAQQVQLQTNGDLGCYVAIDPEHISKLTDGAYMELKLTDTGSDEVVYYMKDQKGIQVITWQYVTGFNFDLCHEMLADPSLSSISIQFMGYNLSRTYTIEVWDTLGNKLGSDLATTISSNSDKIDTVTAELDKSNLNMPGEYIFKFKSDMGGGTVLAAVVLEVPPMQSVEITGFNEARTQNTIGDSTTPSYEFEFSGTNLDGRRLTAELKDAQGAVLETLYSIGVKADDESEHVTFKLAKSLRVLPVGSYGISVVGYPIEYPFEVSEDVNNYYSIYVNIAHDALPNNYNGLSMMLNGRNASFRAVDANGNFVIEGVVNGVYDIRINQPKHLSRNITAVINNADSINNSAILKGGDSNGDGYVGIDDLVILAMSYEAANIDARADINNNDVVDIMDLAALAVNYGNDGVKRIGIQAWGETLDPNRITSSNDMLIANAVYEGLVRVHDGQIQPGMAKNWSVSEDGLTYTFHLRDAYWSDGVPVTAYDFKYSVLRLLDSQYKADYAYQGYYIKNGEAYNKGTMTDASQVGVRVLDEKTLQIELKAPCKFFIALLSSVSFMPVREDIVSVLGENFGKDIDSMVFNGPYVPQGWNLLVRNMDYWNKQLVNIESVDMYDVGNNDQAVSMYESGVLDIVNISTYYIDQYQQNGKIKYAYDGSVWYLQTNVHGKANDMTQGTGKFLNNLNFRKAIALAIDRQQFVDVQTKGVSSPAERYVHPKIMGNAAYYSVEKPLSYYAPNAQVVLAQQHLQAALSELGTTAIPKLELLIDDRVGPYNQAMMLKDMLWQNLGIELDIKAVDFQTRLQLMNNSQYDIVLAGWGPDYDDPMTYLDLWVSGGGFNNTNWSSSEYDALIEFANTATDLEARLNKIFDAENYLLENGPVIPLYFRSSAYVQNDNLEGVVRNFIGPQIDFIYANLNE